MADLVEFVLPLLVPHAPDHARLREPRHAVVTQTPAPLQVALVRQPPDQPTACYDVLAPASPPSARIGRLQTCTLAASLLSHLLGVRQHRHVRITPPVHRHLTLLSSLSHARARAAAAAVTGAQKGLEVPLPLQVSTSEKKARSKELINTTLFQRPRVIQVPLLAHPPTKSTRTVSMGIRRPAVARPGTLQWIAVAVLLSVQQELAQPLLPHLPRVRA